MNILELPQEHPEASDVRVRDTLLVLTRNLYFVHHIIILIYTIMLLVLEPVATAEFTLTLVLIVVYGFLAIELILFNFILIVTLY